MPNRKHLETIAGKNGRATKEYQAWRALKNRCVNPKNPMYPWYGAKGIMVCKRWIKSYDAFLLDMGRAPSKEHSIDRKNNKGNYTPKNCRWATRMEQQNNTSYIISITYKGKTQSLAKWCRELGIVSKAVGYYRVRIREWNPLEAVTTPLHVRKASLDRVRNRTFLT